MTYSGVHLTAADESRLERALGRVREGQYVSAHLPAHAGVRRLLDSLRFRTVFIVRDPRDVAVSDVHYILGFPQHPLHERLSAMPDMTQRLASVIDGLPDRRDGVLLMEPMARRLDDYLGWLDTPGVLTVRFEDLIGPRGGGDPTVQIAAVQAVAAHVMRPLSAEAARDVANAIWSPRSSTFRRGEAGEWREQFEPSHVAAVKAAAGAALIQLGYETDDRW